MVIPKVWEGVPSRLKKMELQEKLQEDEPVRPVFLEKYVKVL
jgi:hypothetical protein